MSSYVGYKPSILNTNKYGKYLQYQFEYLKRGDLKSLIHSIRYVLTHKLPDQDRYVRSEMGNFLIRRNTTDFQFINMTYERKIKQYLQKIKDDIGFFVDIGACIGEYGVWLGHQGIRSYAFEPINYASIQQNIELNKLQKYITLVPKGLGASEHIVHFDALGDVTGSSRKTNEVDTKSVPVQIVCLDNYLKDLQTEKALVLKIDVEGMEPEVLTGAKQLLINTKDIRIIYEYTICKDNNVRAVLDSLGEWNYTDLDGVNMLATKKKMK